MGGIGVEFARLQERPSYLTVLRVFGYSLALSVGPWLATIFAVGFVSLIGIRLLGFPDATFFTTTVMYVFAASLIVSGPAFMIFSRFLADRAYAGESDQRRALLVVEAAAVAVGLLVGWALGRIFTPASLGHSALHRIAVAALSTALAGTWCALAYLDFQKRFAASLYIFVFGCFLSVAFAYLLRGLGNDGLLAGFAGGLSAAFVLLLAVALRKPTEGRAGPFHPADLLAYVKNFAILGWIGLLYNAGTWADKFYLWAVAGQTVPATRFRIFQPYDIATFLSYLIMMPAVSYFLVMVETRFYGNYRSYLEHLERSPLRVVDERRDALWRTLKRGMNNLFELELVVGATGFFLGSFILRRLGIEEPTVAIFRVLIGAAFFQVMFWIHLILLLYFEFRWRALLLSAAFLAMNVGFTALNAAAAGRVGYGWGYLAAGALASVLSWTALRSGLKNLNRHIFFVNSGR